MILQVSFSRRPWMRSFPNPPRNMSWRCKPGCLFFFTAAHVLGRWYFECLYIYTYIYIYLNIYIYTHIEAIEGCYSWLILQSRKITHIHIWYLFLCRFSAKASWKHRHDMIATHFPFPWVSSWVSWLTGPFLFQESAETSNHHCKKRRNALQFTLPMY